MKDLPLLADLVNRKPEPGRGQQRYWGAHLSIAGGLVLALERAASIGATALQIFTRNQRQWKAPPLNLKQVVDFRQGLEESRLGFLCTHASYLCNLASPDRDLREKSIAVLLDEVERAEQIGANCLVMHPGATISGDRRDGLARVKEGLQCLLERTAGMKTGIALENTAGQGSCLGGPLMDLIEVVEALDRDPRLGFCLDTAHAFAAGIDLPRPGGAARWIDELTRSGMEDRLWLLHLNDSLYDCGSRRDRHTHIGQGKIGDIGFRNLLSLVQLLGVPAIIETPKEERSAGAGVWDRRNLQRLYELAADGLQAGTAMA